MALVPRQLLFLDPPQRELPEEGLRHKGDKGDEGLLMENRQTTAGTRYLHPPAPPLLPLSLPPPSSTNVTARTCTLKEKKRKDGEKKTKPLAHT